MIKASDTRIEDVLPLLSDKGLDVALLVPTETGMSKSIMDATLPVRQYLLRNNLHNYDNQEQGESGKRLIPTFFVNATKAIETVTSAYRPVTKKGDPRIWFGRLKQFCVPNNLLAILTYDGALYVINLSDAETIHSLKNGYGEALKVINRILSVQDTVANELLEKLKEIHRMGFVKSIIQADTGIGMTLEQLLGIPPNASKAPDYKGIELKASRGDVDIRARNRVNLFSQIPNWKKSHIHTAQELLNLYGYEVEGRQQLYCTLTTRPNPQGLYFEVNENADELWNRYCDPQSQAKQNVVLWEMDVLRDRINTKHRETFWVKAATSSIDGFEHFRFDSVVHTRKPNVNLLGALVEQNIITMDYTLSQKGNRVRDHGYLFKIRPENVNLLFPNPEKYYLDVPREAKSS
jgi:hypothetical protein